MTRVPKRPNGAATPAGGGNLDGSSPPPAGRTTGTSVRYRVALTTPEELDRFEAKIEPAGPYDCWNWTGAKDQHGYGRFLVARKNRRAHRVAYETFFRDVPEGQELDHVCRNRGCVNPAHLEAVTHRENLLRGDTIVSRRVGGTL